MFVPPARLDDTTESGPTSPTIDSIVIAQRIPSTLYKCSGAETSMCLARNEALDVGLERRAKGTEVEENTFTLTGATNSATTTLPEPPNTGLNEASPSAKRREEGVSIDACNARTRAPSK